MLIEQLEAHAEARGSYVAIVHGEERVTYADLAERVQRLARGLSASGVAAGDPVALLLPNSPAFAVAFLAAAAIGAVVVPLNPQFKQEEIGFYFDNSGIRAVIGDEHGIGVAERILAAGEREPVTLIATDAAAPGTLSLELLVADHEPGALAPRAPEEDMVFLYSSGSTGRPKRVARTHELCQAECDNYTRTMGIGAHDTIFCAVPMYHSYGMGLCLLAPVASGATLVILEDPHPFVLRRQRALELIAEHRATIFPGVPYIFRLLAEAGAEADLSSLRMCFSAGTALPHPVFLAFLERHGHPVRQVYGSTEAGIMAVNLDPDPVPTATSVGAPVQGVTVRILDEDGAPTPFGAEGEIEISSPALVSGYADAEGADLDAFRNGSFLTGDLGRLDPDGRLYITGRKKLLIDVAGQKVDPVDVEDVLRAHPKVRDVVVLGVKGRAVGEEAVKAAVVASEDCEERELIQFCRARLANFKVPTVVEFRDEIPKSPVGKILRKYLL
jgi:long-chain acyl-CoA synthetase